MELVIASYSSMGKTEQTDDGCNVINCGSTTGCPMFVQSVVMAYMRQNRTRIITGHPVHILSVKINNPKM